MDNKKKSLVILFLWFAVLVHAQAENDLKLWYNKPAFVWNEALPLGNGRLGAMVFGEPSNEKIQLNESSFWSGGPSCNDNPEAGSALDSVRQAIFAGNFLRAESLINRHMTAKQLQGSIFQVVGELNIVFPGNEGYTDYYRELDLNKAVFTTRFKKGGVTYTRQLFVSQPDQVIVMKLTADNPGKISCTLNFDSPLKQWTGTKANNSLEMIGLSSTHEGVAGQVRFDARANVQQLGGQMNADSGMVCVSNASEVTIRISVATNFVDYKTLTANEKYRSETFLHKATKKSYSVLLKNHVLAYQKYFNRVKLDLGTSGAAAKPTDERIRDFSKSYDPQLISLYYQFGRYLLIACSQPGGQPANLQGIWNGSVYPAWDSKYTININTEMNYWPAEKCNLAEMHEPLIRMIKELAVTGSQTARVMYGCKGWVAHHNTDIWRISGVVDGAFWGMWPMGSAWLSQHLWEKYLYNGDKDYLKSVYPVMRSACEFYTDFLTEEPTHKWLVVCPSISPENSPKGHGTSVSAGTTMDNQLLFDLFNKTIKAAHTLHLNDTLIPKLQHILTRLPPMQVGKFGQLQEWLDDLDDPNDDHRHVSHLYGLYPGGQLSPSTTPVLFEAARTSLLHRGDVSTGWSMGWKVNWWAHLLDGNHAFKLIKDQLTLVDPVKPARGGTYPNFFDAHPPFQIDGNFGCVSGITEMLLQCNGGAIYVLPALPDDWTDGSVTGLRAYGGFEVSIVWKKKKVVQLTIESKLGGNCRIRVANELTGVSSALKPATASPNPNPFFEVFQVKQPVVVDPSVLGDVPHPSARLYDLSTKAGCVYNLYASDASDSLRVSFKN